MIQQRVPNYALISLTGEFRFKKEYALKTYLAWHNITVVRVLELPTLWWETNDKLLVLSAGKEMLDLFLFWS